MVGIAGYKCIVCKKQQKHKGHIGMKCNVLNKIVKKNNVDLFPAEIFGRGYDIPVCIGSAARKSPVISGEKGVMETIFPHCQQSFQHKCMPINEVM